MSGPLVLLATLSVRTSARDNAYLSGWLGKAEVVGFAGEPDKYGNETWNLYVSEPEQRGGQTNDRAGHNRPVGSQASDERSGLSAAHPSVRRSGRQDDGRDTADAPFGWARTLSLLPTNSLGWPAPSGWRAHHDRAAWIPGPWMQGEVRRLGWPDTSRLAEAQERVWVEIALTRLIRSIGTVKPKPSKRRAA